MGREQTQRFRDLLRQAQSDPLRAQRIAGTLLAELDRSPQPDTMSTTAQSVPDARSPATRIVRSTGPALPPGTTSPDVQLDFSTAGWILAVYGNAIDTDPFLSATALGFNVRWRGGDKNLVTNGQAADFALYSSLFGLVPGAWFPLCIRITAEQTTVNIQWRNESALSTLRPALHFSFLPRAVAEAIGFRWGDPDVEDD